MTQINLIPWREQARQVKKMRFAMLAGAAVFVGFVLVLILHFHFSKLIRHQNARNSFLQSKLGENQTKLNELNNKYKEQIITETELKFIYGLRANSYRAVSLLNTIATVVPEAVTFNKLIRNGNKITIIGRASSNLQVTQLMKNISAAPIFNQPDLTEISAKELTSGVERFFQITIEQHG